MARILVVTWAGGGNVPPAITLATELARRGHDVRAHRHRVARPPVRVRRHPVRRPRAARRVGPVRRWRATCSPRPARPTSSCATTCSRPRLSAGEAAGVPVVALVHTLYTANLDDSGGLHPMGMAISIDSLATVRAELQVPAVASFGALLDRCATRAGDVPGVARRPVTRPARPRPLRRAAAGTARRRRRLATPGVDDGRPLVVAGLGTTPMDELPVLQRVVTALGAAPVRGIVTLGDHLDPDDLDVPDGRAAHWLRSPHRDAPVGIGGGHPRRPRHRAGRAVPRPAAWCASPSAASSPPTPTRSPRVGAGVVLDAGVVAGGHRRGDRPRRHRPRAPRRCGADGRGDRRARCGRVRP